MEGDDFPKTNDAGINPESAKSYLPQSDIAEEHSSSQTATGTNAPSESFQKPSLVEDKPAIAQNTKQAYPTLKLSGNIISATICLPYNFEHGPSGWVCKICMYLD